MRIGIVKYPLLIALALLPLAAFGNDTLYVQSTKAKLLEQPSFSAKTVKELVKGDKVTVQQKNDRWVRVTHGGIYGWISSLLLSAQKPVDKITVLDDADGGIGGNARIRASAVITAGATRGLTADDRRRASDEGTANYVALRWVDNIKITDADIARFEAEDSK